MAKQLLDHAQVGTAVEQMGRRAVPQSVWADIRRIRDVSQQRVDDIPDLAGIDAPTSPAQEQRGTALGSHQLSAVSQPGVDRVPGRDAEWHHSLLGAFTGDPNEVGRQVEVVHVDGDQLTDPDPTGVEQLQDRAVPDMDRILVVGRDLGYVEQFGSVTLT
jgi:hypothetical protein